MTAGTYTLRIAINNPDAQGKRLFEEVSYENNVHFVNFTLVGGFVPPPEPNTGPTCSSPQYNISTEVLAADAFTAAWVPYDAHTRVVLRDEDSAAIEAATFTLEFHCSGMTRWWLNSNGFLTATAPSSEPLFNNVALPKHGTIAVAWDDWCVSPRRRCETLRHPRLVHGRGTCATHQCC